MKLGEKELDEIIEKLKGRATRRTVLRTRYGSMGAGR